MSPPPAHSDEDPRPAPAWARRLALLLLIPAALLTALGMLLLWPHDTPDPAAERRRHHAAGELLTGELIAQELVRSAVGTIGLITAVPITTALAAVAAVHHRRPADERHDRHAETAGESGQPATRPPADDPWAAFVERHPGWRNE